MNRRGCTRSGVTMFAALLVCVEAALSAPTQVSPAGRKAMAPDLATGPRAELYVLWLDKEPATSTPATANVAANAATTTPDAASRGAAPPADAHSRHSSTMDLWIARSDDAGRSFGPPVRVNDRPGEVWGFSSSRPRIAVGATGTVHVLWPANAIGAGGKPILEVHYARSTDRARSFESSRRLNATVEADASALIHGGFAVAHAFQALTAGTDGSVDALWIDTRNLRTAQDLGEVYAVRSSDDGRSFGAERRLFGEVCPCCQITATKTSDGGLWVGSRLVGDGNQRDASVTHSTDGGRSFGPRVPVAGPRWQIDGCPLKPTALAIDGRHVYTAVFNGAGQPAGVYFSASQDSGSTFTGAMALHPEAAVSDAPVLAVSREGTLHAVWHAKVGELRRLYTRSSSDHGSQWSAIRELQTPAGSSAFPALARAPDGSVFVAWQQGEQVWLDRMD